VRRLREILARPRVSEVLVYILVAAGAALLYLPALGRDGLWDPWESHYAEVARRIVVDNDWIVLRWHDESFYSKPVLLFWLVALCFKILGVSDLAARLPVALVAVAGIVLVYRFVRIHFGRIHGVAAAACLGTMPLYLFVGRQNMTDLPFVIALSAGLLGVMHRILVEKGGLVTVLLAYACFAIATLAKGLLGFAFPGAVILLWLIVTGRWAVLRKLQILPGVLVFLAIATPWYVAITIKQGTAFAYEFFYLHHLARAGGGVHGERGTFEYFVNQGGYAILPWLACAPAALARLSERFVGERDASADRNLFVVIWAIAGFALFTIARTKFHHYILPALPAVAIAIGVWLPEAVRRGIGTVERLLVVLGGVMALVAARDLAIDPNRLVQLFTYAYERPLPQVGGMRAAVLVVLVALAAGAVAVTFARKTWTRAAGAGITAAAALGFSLVLVHHMMPRISLDIGQAECFAIWNSRDPEPGDRFYNWKMNWRGEVYQSRDTIPKVSRLDQLRNLLSKPGRLYVITTTERFIQLDQEVERMRGRPLERLNAHRYRYIMGVWDGPVLPPRAPEPYVQGLPAGSTEVHATLGGRMIEFVGYRVDARSVKLGGSFLVTLYWRALRRVPTRYLVFIHGEVPLRGEMKRFTGNHITGEGFWGPEAWKTGRLVEDTFSVCVDYGNPLGDYVLYTGLYKDEDRLAVDDAALHDGHDRFTIGDITVRQ